MVFDLVKKTVDRIFGETNEQRLKQIDPILAEVNSHADATKALSNEQLTFKTPEFKARLEQGETLDDILPEAYAVVRETAHRLIGLRPYDVQIIGGIVLHNRKIAEMRTGEGKTLVATMPAYLNALAGKVHIVTVNDYLAKRDCEWMSPVYKHLGLTVGLIQEDTPPQERSAAYQCDILYGTNTQFGFDYLRDNLVMSWDQKTQASLDYAIVDEIDNILIDEARTPLIISGSTSESQKLYKQFAKLSPRFRKDEDFELDEKTRRVHLTEAGVQRAEELVGVENLYSPQNIELVHHLELSLRARLLYHKDVDYIVKDGRVVIVDEFTGRLMEDRRYSDGLHQALEAKESMEVKRESQTLAQVTLQHYFRLYKGLSGMTGTAATEEDEFKEIYGLGVMVIPTHRPMVREDLPDVLFKSEKEKFKAIADEIEQKNRAGRPVLIGTNSIDKSEYLSQLLKRRGLIHNVLNAKQHEREAEIIKDAGEKSAITVATNMAGRGVDIKLGTGIADLGGLHIIGCQRHESRRIDDQLRGRAGRQGDPGSSQFFVSLDDDLLRLFGEQKMVQWALKGLQEGESLEHNILSKAMRTAQQRVEAHNFSIRKRLLDYDAVMARQREAIYALRDRFLLNNKEDEVAIRADLDEYLLGVLASYAQSLTVLYCPDPNRPHAWDYEGLKKDLEGFQNVRFSEEFREKMNLTDVEEIVREFLEKNYRAQSERLGTHFPQIARLMILNIIDEHWRQHLYALDDLREGIGWRSYQGRDPLVEFQRESFRLFQEMLGRVEEQLVNILVKPELKMQQAPAESRNGLGNVRYQHDAVNGMEGNSSSAGSDSGTLTMQGGGATATTKAKEPRRVAEKAQRNDPCPCGSGKKYKHCHGARE
ncbi:preprotein translocase subunit SecA [Candidatus Acetothermia bacterium]|nr:preprotein translocase subunit SecA [Candidatus Acetothermia bacterium]MBI3643962.1 preprotein translocase subunit SecA [Candidatus Acetothermia bacterium]